MADERRPRRPLRVLCGVLLLLLLSGLPGDLQALELSYQYQESRLQLAYLYNFSKFIVWPAQALPNDESPLVFGLTDPQLLVLAESELGGRFVRGHQLELRLVGDAGDLPGCHLIFFSVGDAPQLQRWLSAAADLPLVTVAQQPDFAAAGGVIELFQRGRKLRFGVNLAAARRVGLSVSAELLRLASFVLPASDSEVH